MSGHLDLSVIVPTYSNRSMLEACLTSMGAQEFDLGAVEIIVIDDGTPGFHPEGLAPLCAPFCLEVISHEVNRGRARSRNAGIRAASGNAVLFLDSDMTVVPGFFQAHAAFHRAHVGEVAVGAIRFAPGITANALTRYVESRGANAHPPGGELPFKCFVTGNSSMARQQLLDTGLFDEAFTAYGGEDLELGYRLHRAGARFRFAHDALAYHHHLRDLGALCDLMAEYGGESLPLLMAKHPALAPLLHLGFLTRRPFSVGGLIRRLALTPGLCRWVRHWIGEHVEGHVPAVLFSYLWWCSRTRAYLQAADGGPGSPPGGRVT